MGHVSKGRHRDGPERDRRQLPAWLVGLILAALLFLVGLVVFGALGFGDNPVLDPDATELARLVVG